MKRAKDEPTRGRGRPRLSAASAKREATSPSPSRPKHPSPNQIETPIPIQSNPIQSNPISLSNLRDDVWVGISATLKVSCLQPPTQSISAPSRSIDARHSLQDSNEMSFGSFVQEQCPIQLTLESSNSKRERERERRMSYAADMIDGRGFRSGSTICSCDHRHSFVSHCSSLSSSITTTAIIITTTAAKRYEPIQQLCLGRTTDCASKSPRTTRREAALGCQRTK